MPPAIHPIEAAWLAAGGGFSCGGVSAGAREPEPIPCPAGETAIRGCAAPVAGCPVAGLGTPAALVTGEA